VIIKSTASEFRWSVWSKLKKKNCFLLFVCYILNVHKMKQVKIIV